MLLQTAQSASPLDVRDLVQYVANAATLGIFGFVWQMNARVKRIETVLFEPDVGVVATLGAMRKGDFHINRDVTQHGVRLDGHDREIERLDRDKEPRRSLQPGDIGTLDRRAKS